MSDPFIGRVIDGRYAIEAQLGEGGLGVVYRAKQTRLGRPVAVKVLHAEHAKTAQLRARFEREARSLGSLVHPNIVQVIDFGLTEGAPYLVMELLEGRPLNEAIRATIELPRAFEIGRAIVAAVAYAHAQGVVHRDLKPANVFLQKTPGAKEIPRVLDFGLAKFIGAEGDGDAAPLTKVGTILGTPSYMSPEQASGAPSDARSDVYSLAIVLFELLSGTRPFRGSPQELLRMHLLNEMPKLESARAGIPHAERIDAVLGRAAAKPIRDRYADAGELLAALDALPPLAGAAGARRAQRASAAPDFTFDNTLMAQPAAESGGSGTGTKGEPSFQSLSLEDAIATGATMPPAPSPSASRMDAAAKGAVAAPGSAMAPAPSSQGSVSMAPAPSSQGSVSMAPTPSSQGSVTTPAPRKIASHAPAAPGAGASASGGFSSPGLDAGASASTSSSGGSSRNAGAAGTSSSGGFSLPGLAPKAPEASSGGFSAPVPEAFRPPAWSAGAPSPGPAAAQAGVARLRSAAEATRERMSSRPWFPWALGALGLSLVALAFGLFSGEDAQDAAAPSGAGVAANGAPAAPLGDDAEGADTGEPRASGGGQGEALPAELQAIVSDLRPGGRLSIGARRQLNAWSRAHRGDPRAWIVTAHADLENGARTDALRWYGKAVETSPEAAEDPTLRRDLVIMAGHGKVGRRAQAMVLELFPSDAPAEITRALREERLNSNEQRRLERFLASLR